MLDLAPDALVIRPFWSSPLRAKFPIPREAITSANLRPPRLGEFGKVMDDGIYPAGAIFAWAAFVVIICESADGKFELGVARTCHWSCITSILVPRHPPMESNEVRETRLRPIIVTRNRVPSCGFHRPVPLLEER